MSLINLIKPQYSYLPYIIISSIHSSLKFLKYENVSKFTKCFLIPLLALSFTIQNEYKITNISHYIIFLLHWLGDILLLTSNFKIFLLGCLTFWIGDLIIAKNIFDMLPENFYKNLAFSSILFVSAYLYVIYGFMNKYLVKNKHREHAVIFGLPLLIMNIFALTLSLCSSKIEDYILFIGTFSFIFSDFAIIQKNFVYSFSEKEDFIIISTYCLAEGLIFVRIGNPGFLSNISFNNLIA